MKTETLKKIFIGVGVVVIIMGLLAAFAGGSNTATNNTQTTYSEESPF